MVLVCAARVVVGRRRRRRRWGRDAHWLPLGPNGWGSKGLSLGSKYPSRLGFFKPCTWVRFLRTRTHTPVSLIPSAHVCPRNSPKTDLEGGKRNNREGVSCLFSLSFAGNWGECALFLFPLLQVVYVRRRRRRRRASGKGGRRGCLLLRRTAPSFLLLSTRDLLAPCLLLLFASTYTRFVRA